MEMYSSSMMNIHQLDISSYVYKRSKDLTINFQCVLLYIACMYSCVFLCN